jgi:radical SAM superfamily enzyme YgiQ (UPF0313 family)
MQAHMRRHVYYIQPTYRKMDGKLAKGWTLFNATLNIAMLSAATPVHWEKSLCLEYFDNIDYDSIASVIILTSMGYDIEHSMEIAREFRRRGKLVIFGGHNDEFTDTLMSRACHSVFYGIPGKEQMHQVLEDALRGDLKQRYDCGVHINYPFDYSVFGNRKMRHLPVLASAGCKHKCEFCCYPVVYNGNYYLRDIQHVISDLKSARSKTRLFAFKDANIYNNREFILSLCREIQKEKLGIKWGAQCTIGVGDDTEVLRELKAAGCGLLFIGYESLSRENTRQVAKPANPESYEQLTLRIRKSGIHVAGYFVLGLDHDNRSTFDEIYTFVRRTKIALPLINMLVPIPGSKIHERLKQQGRLLIPNENVFLTERPRYSVPCNRALYEPANFTVEELEYKFTDLADKLTQYREILRRSIVKSPFESLQILKMNLDLRKEHRKLAQADHIN